MKFNIGDKVRVSAQAGQGIRDAHPGIGTVVEPEPERPNWTVRVRFPESTCTYCGAAGVGGYFENYEIEKVEESK